MNTLRDWVHAWIVFLFMLGLVALLLWLAS